MKISGPELAMIAVTRGMLGVGVGLLLASRMTDDHRRLVGKLLVGIGVASTIPLALEVFGRGDDDAPAWAREPRPF